MRMRDNGMQMEVWMVKEKRRKKEALSIYWCLAVFVGENLYSVLLAPLRRRLGQPRLLATLRC